MKDALERHSPQLWNSEARGLACLPALCQAVFVTLSSSHIGALLHPFLFLAINAESWFLPKHCQMNRNAKPLSLKLNIKVAAKGKNYSIEGKKIITEIKKRAQAPKQLPGHRT